MPTSNLGRGFAAYRAGDYHDAAKALRAAPSARGLRNDDWAVFLLAESEFYEGDYRAARAALRARRQGHGGRPAAMAPVRSPTASGWRASAPRPRPAYARLVKKAAPTTGDVGAGALPHRGGGGRARRRPRRQAVPGDRARLPGPPARRRGAAAGGAAAPRRGDRRRRRAAGRRAPDLSAPDRLRRAEALTKDRHWDEALAELAQAARRRCRPSWRPSATTRSG